MTDNDRTGDTLTWLNLKRNNRLLDKGKMITEGIGYFSKSTGSGVGFAGKKRLTHMVSVTFHVRT
jgi:hypothetical protein